ncbi:hypothetical protein AVEN_31433-1, partial [Araneus ventricosus]
MRGALKISNSWKKVFLLAAESRKAEILKVIPAKMKEAKEEEAILNMLKSDERLNVDDEGRQLATSWRKIFENVVNMKKREIEQIKRLINEPESSNLDEKAVSSLDPCNRKTSVALELTKELPLYASNVVQDSEKEAYDLERHNFQNDHFSDIVEESVDLWWRDVENTSKYHLLSRMTFALLTCFHEPKVESSFSIMNNV